MGYAGGCDQRLLVVLEEVPLFVVVAVGGVLVVVVVVVVVAVELARVSMRRCRWPEGRRTNQG